MDPCVRKILQSKECEKNIPSNGNIMSEGLHLVKRVAQSRTSKKTCGAGKWCMGFTHLEVTNGASGKESTCSAGDIRDVGLIPGLGRLSGGQHSNLLDILAWRIPWTEEPGW